MLHASGGKPAKLSDVLTVMEGMEPDTEYERDELKEKVEAHVGERIDECTFLGMLDTLQKKGRVQFRPEVTQVRLKRPHVQPWSG
eukprot:11196613-Lingulodinium_polyedra.AAC.1